MIKDVDSFAKLEKQWMLFDRTYGGFPYWMYIRFTVCESLFGERALVEGRVSASYKISFWKRIYYSLLDLLKDTRLLLFGRKVDVILFRQNDLKDSFFDSWKLPDNIRTYSFYSEEQFQKYNKNHHYFGLARIKTGLKRKINILAHNYNFDEEERKFLINLETELKSRYGQCISWQKMEEAICEARLAHTIYKKYYHSILKKLQCSRIITIVYYQPILFPAYEVAKELGVRVDELQHGVINNHISYLFEDSDNKNIITPDVLLTFGDMHNSWVRLNSNYQPISVGFPSQEISLNRYKGVATKGNTVVIYPEPFEEYEHVIDEFINHYRNYEVIIKLHPLQFGHVNEFFPVLARNRNAVFIDNQEKDIYYWLKYAKHHVMISTTVGLEAMAFDHCNVCIFEDAPHEQTQCLLDWGVARAFKTAKELAYLIDNPLSDKGDLKNIRDGLWKRNARENIESYFEHCLT